MVVGWHRGGMPLPIGGGSIFFFFLSSFRFRIWLQGGCDAWSPVFGTRKQSPVKAEGESESVKQMSL